MPGKPLTYGQSITDGCIDWETTVPALNLLADAVAARREARRRQLPGAFGLDGFRSRSMRAARLIACVAGRALATAPRA